MECEFASLNQQKNVVSDFNLFYNFKTKKGFQVDR